MVTKEQEIRNMVLGILSIFHEEIVIDNYSIPFYFSMAGNERFLMDNFLNGDVAESMYNKVPRGAIDLQSITVAQENLLARNSYGIIPTLTEDGKQVYKEYKMNYIPVELNIEAKIVVSNLNQALKVSTQLIKRFYKNRVGFIHTNNITIPIIIRLSEDIDLNKLIDFSWDVNDKLNIPLNFDVLSYIVDFDDSTETLHGKGMQGGLINNIIIKEIENNQKDSLDKYITTYKTSGLNNGVENTVKISLNK